VDFNELRYKTRRCAPQTRSMEQRCLGTYRGQRGKKDPHPIEIDTSTVDGPLLVMVKVLA